MPRYPMILSFWLEMKHFLPITKLSCSGLKMTTTVGFFYESVVSWQCMDQDKVGVGVNISLLSLSFCSHIWPPTFLARHVVNQGHLASSESEFNIPC